ncbi:MAG: flagellar export chaperone FliS, partial [Bacillota bacterium]
SSYRKVQIETAPPHRLVAMLLHGAVTRCEQAQEALEKGLHEEARPILLKGQDIVAELMASLDFEQGGEIAQRLLLLYDFAHRRLVEANVRQDARAVGEALQVLRGLADAWDALQRGAAEGQPSTAPGQMTGTAAG